VKTARRTEIRVETHELLVIRKRGGLAQGWCERCGKQVGLICLQELTLAGINPDVISRQAEAGQLHLIETPSGLSFFCLNSLFEMRW